MTILNLLQGHISVISGHELHHIEMLMFYLQKLNFTELQRDLPVHVFPWPYD